MRTRRLTPVALLGVLTASACASEISDPAPARLEISTSRLVIADDVDTASVVLRNRGGSSLDWTLNVPVPWLTIMPNSGAVAAGDSVRLQLALNRAPAFIGEHAITVSIHTDAFYAARSLTLVIGVLPDPRATIADADTMIEFPGTDGYFVVRNAGKGDLHWIVSADVPWVQFGWLDHTTAPGDEDRIDVEIDRSLLPRDTSAVITLTSNDTTGARTLRIHVEGTPEREVLPLSFAAPLAVQSNDTVIALAGARTLARLLTTTGALTLIPLPGDARALALRLVSHAGGYTTVEGQFTPTADEPGPLAEWGGQFLSYAPLGAAGAVLVSRSYWWGPEEQHTAGSPLQHLAPHEGALYASSADGIVRYDYGNPSWTVGAPLLIPDIPFASEHRRLWGTPFGLITSSGAILATGTTVAAHVVSGQLSWPGPGPAPAIRSISTVPTLGRIFVVRDSVAGAAAPASIWEYDASLEATEIALPPVDAGGVSVPAEPFAAFYAPGQRRLFVVQRAVTAGGAGTWSVLMLRR